MSLDHLKVKGSHAIEKVLGRGKPRRMPRLILQALPECCGCLCHAHKPFSASMYLTMVSLLTFPDVLGKSEPVQSAGCLLTTFRNSLCRRMDVTPFNALTMSAAQSVG